MRSVLLIVALLASFAPAIGRAQEVENSPDEAASESAPETTTDTPEQTTDAEEPRVERSVVSATLVNGVRPNRLSFSLGAGWPAALLDIDFAASDTLMVGLRAGYCYGAAHGGLRRASGALLALGTRLRLMQRGRIELSFGSAAGVVFAADREMALVRDDVYPNDPDGTNVEVTPLTMLLDIDVTLSWRILPSLAIKLGLAIPTTFVLDMAERPYDDAWELAVPFAARVGAAYQLTEWMSVHALVDVGPVLTVEPVAITAEGLEHDVGAEFFLRASAGVTFTPWR